MSSLGERPALSERQSRYARALRDAGYIRSSTVEEAFASVPRHRFLTSFRLRGKRHELDHEVGQPPDDVLDLIYANNSLPTRDGSDGEPISSSSEPALMAVMLELAELAPGMRVLEIGAGTGYNAALIARLTGAAVASIEAGRATAEAAAAAIRRACLDGHVRIVHGDGYLGDPEHGPWDRVIVTCGIAGVPPGWVTQLADGGVIIAPVAHAGYHPVVVIRQEDGLVGQVGVWADFMPAVGSLRPAAMFGHRSGAPVHGELRWFPRAVEPTTVEEYKDLTFAIGAQDHRANRATTTAAEFRPGAGATALIDDGAAAWVQRSGDLAATGRIEPADALVARLQALVEAWELAGRPEAEEWSATFERAQGVDPSLLVPRGWTTSRATPNGVEPDRTGDR